MRPASFARELLGLAQRHPILDRSSRPAGKPQVQWNTLSTNSPVRSVSFPRHDEEIVRDSWPNGNDGLRESFGFGLEFHWWKHQGRLVATFWHSCSTSKRADITGDPGDFNS